MWPVTNGHTVMSATKPITLNMRHEQVNIILANVIDGVSGPDSIASHWKQHFHKLLNVHVHVSSDNSLKDDILSNFD